MAQSGFDLEADGFVGFTEMFTALGMTEFDDIEIAVLEHQWRNLAGPCTLFGPVHVLCANLDGSAGRDFLHFAHGGKRRDDETLDVGGTAAIGSFQCLAKTRASASVLFIFQLVPIQNLVMLNCLSISLCAVVSDGQCNTRLFKIGQYSRVGEASVIIASKSERSAMTCRAGRPNRW